MVVWHQYAPAVAWELVYQRSITVSAPFSNFADVDFPNEDMTRPSYITVIGTDLFVLDLETTPWPVKIDCTLSASCTTSSAPFDFSLALWAGNQPGFGSAVILDEDIHSVGSPGTYPLSFELSAVMTTPAADRAVLVEIIADGGATVSEAVLQFSIPA